MSTTSTRAPARSAAATARASFCSTAVNSRCVFACCCMLLLVRVVRCVCVCVSGRASEDLRQPRCDSAAMRSSLSLLRAVRQTRTHLLSRPPLLSSSSVSLSLCPYAAAGWVEPGESGSLQCQESLP
jgi:hypothetical protein